MKNQEKEDLSENLRIIATALEKINLSMEIDQNKETKNPYFDQKITGIDEKLNYIYKLLNDQEKRMIKLEKNVLEENSKINKSNEDFQKLITPYIKKQDVMNDLMVSVIDSLKEIIEIMEKNGN